MFVVFDAKKVLMAVICSKPNDFQVAFLEDQIIHFPLKIASFTLGLVACLINGALVRIYRWFRTFTVLLLFPLGM